MDKIKSHVVEFSSEKGMETFIKALREVKNFFHKRNVKFIKRGEVLPYFCFCGVYENIPFLFVYETLLSSNLSRVNIVVYYEEIEDGEKVDTESE